MYNEVMFSIENNLFEERLSSKESFRRAIALWKNINPAKKETEAKRILKAAKREGYIVKQKEILAYADEDISSMKAKKSVRRDLRAKKKAKRDERFEQVKANVEEKDIEDKIRIELLAIAIKKGLKTTPKMNRQELIDLIQGDEKEVKTKLSQEEISKYLKNGDRNIDQEVFDKLSPEEIQTYFKANMQANDGLLSLDNLETLPNGIKFPEKCERLDLSSLESLPEGIKFPEGCEWLNLSSLQYLPNGIKFPEKCERLYLYNLKSLPEGIKFPEKCDYLFLNNLRYLPENFFKKHPYIKGKVSLRNGDGERT